MGKSRTISHMQYIYQNSYITSSAALHLDNWVPFGWYDLNLIPVWQVIIHPVECEIKLLINSKLQRYNRWSLRMDKQFHPTQYIWCNYLSMMGLTSIHDSKRALWCLYIYHLASVFQHAWFELFFFQVFNIPWSFTNNIKSTIIFVFVPFLSYYLFFDLFRPHIHYTISFGVIDIADVTIMASLYIHRNQ